MLRRHAMVAPRRYEYCRLVRKRDLRSGRQIRRDRTFALALCSTNLARCCCECIRAEHGVLTLGTAPQRAALKGSKICRVSPTHSVAFEGVFRTARACS